MSLNDYIARKRAQTGIETSPSEAESAASPPVSSGLKTGVTSCAPDKAVKSALLLRCWNREVWGFPWPCLTEAHFTPADSSNADSLCLAFGSREVTLRGRNLAGLMDSVAQHLLCEVREVPQEHMTPADAESVAPVVWEIRVCERAK